MKKIALILTLILLVSAGFAQRSKVVTAYNYQRNGKLEKAKEAIDEAVEHEKTMADPKAWFYRGAIYQDIAAGVDSSLYKKVPNAIDIAYESYQKSVQYDEKEKYVEQIKLNMAGLAQGYYNKGVMAYNDNNFSEASDQFKNTFDVYSEIGRTDTISMFNAAVSAGLAGENEKALDYYDKVLELDYSNPEIYISMSEINKAMGDTTEALEVLKTAREIYPENFDLLISETNIYLARNDTKKALENLEKAIEKDKTNPTIFFAVGTNYDQLGMFEKAEDAYKNAINLDPDYFEANYNIGALYVNKAAKILEKANDLPLDAVDEYDAEKAKADDLLKKSLPYLEKAIELQPNDVNTLVSLKEIYTRLGMQEKLKAVNAKLEK